MPDFNLCSVKLSKIWHIFEKWLSRGNAIYFLDVNKKIRFLWLKNSMGRFLWLKNLMFLLGPFLIERDCVYNSVQQLQVLQKKSKIKYQPSAVPIICWRFSLQNMDVILCYILIPNVVLFNLNMVQLKKLFLFLQNM